MNDVQVIDTLIQKRTEGVQRYRFSLIQDDVAAMPDDRYTYTATLATEESLIKKVDMKIVQGSLVQFDSDQIADVPAGVYRLEIWETVNDAIHAIFPSDRVLKFRVLENTMDLPQGTISSLTLDQFEKRFDDLAKKFSTGSFETPRFKVGKTVTAEPGQPATVEMITNDDGSVTINYAIPKGEKGDTWEPYIADDGYLGDWTNIAFVQDGEKWGPLTSYECDAPGGTLGQFVKFQPGPYTWSAFIKLTGYNDPNNVGFEPQIFAFQQSGPSFTNLGQWKISHCTVRDQWMRVSVSFDVTREETLCLYIVKGWTGIGGTLHVAGQKLEKGTSLTDYITDSGTTVTAPECTDPITTVLTNM